MGKATAKPKSLENIVYGFGTVYHDEEKGKKGELKIPQDGKWEVLESVTDRDACIEIPVVDDRVEDKGLEQDEGR